MTAAIIIGNIPSAMAHELPLYAFFNASQPSIVLEGVPEGMEHHAPIGHAADLPTIDTPMLTPLGG
jgi:hypothetical protein